MARISIIGGYGAVGRMAALLLGQKKLAEHIVLVGPNAKKGEAAVLDLADAFAIGSSETNITFSVDTKAIEDSSIVIVTAGKFRTPDMPRSELVPVNAGIVRQAAEDICNYAPDAFVIVVTNPLDAMVEQAYRAKGGNPRMIVGMAGMLDSARFRNFIAESCGVPAGKVEAMILGEHGESMVPLTSRARVEGKALSEFCTSDQIARIVGKTRDAGKTILELTGVPANIAPAVAVVEMAEDFLRNRQRLIASCIRSEGIYGLPDVFIGLPSRIGSQGAVPVELPITAEEREALHASATQIRAATQRLPQTNTCHL